MIKIHSEFHVCSQKQVRLFVLMVEHYNYKNTFYKEVPKARAKTGVTYQD